MQRANRFDVESIEPRILLTAVTIVPIVGQSNVVTVQPGIDYTIDARNAAAGVKVTIIGTQDKYWVPVKVYGSAFPDFVDVGSPRRAAKIMVNGDLGAGNDSFRSFSWRTANITGGADNDTLAGGYGPDTILGGDGNDRIATGDGNNKIDGQAGDDRLSVGSYTGRNTLIGGLGDDRLFGGDGNDYLDAGDGNDLLVGGLGRDILHAGAGDDSLEGGQNNTHDNQSDILDGADGSDTAYYDNADVQNQLEFLFKEN